MTGRPEKSCWNSSVCGGKASGVLADHRMRVSHQQRPVLSKFTGGLTHIGKFRPRHSHPRLSSKSQLAHIGATPKR